MREEDIIEKAIIEYDEYQNIYIASYGECRGEGKTQLEATMCLLEDVAWAESEDR